MTQEPRAHLLLICHAGADLAARADARVAAAAGYASATHLGAGDLDLPDAARLTFRAAVPGAILRHLSALPPADILLVEIIEDPDALSGPADPAPPARLIAAALDQPQGFTHGQALCWPQDHHVAFPAFGRLGADGADMGARPFLWPSPSVYRAGPECQAFLTDWASAAADPAVSGDVAVPPGQGSDLLRGHEGAWAAGSVLAHLHGAATLSLPQADPSGDLIGPLTCGGLTPDQAEAWLALPDGPARVGPPQDRASSDDAQLVAQLDQIAISGRGRICRDHLVALLRQDGRDDLMLAVLTDSRARVLTALWPVLASRVNLAWIEQVMDGQSHDLHDLRVIINAELAARVDESDKIALMLACSMIWHLIRSEGRGRYRRRYGAFASAQGQQMMQRFVLSLPDADRQRLTRPMPLEEAETRVSPDLCARIEAWMQQVPA